MTRLVGEDFFNLFRTFEHTAYRLEVRESYYEKEQLSQFLAGEQARATACGCASTTSRSVKTSAIWNASTRSGYRVTTTGCSIPDACTSCALPMLTSYWARSRS